MSFNVAKNGMRMYTPSWQQSPGAAMKAANRASSDAYFENFSALGSNLLGATTSETSSMMDIITNIVTERLQADYQKKQAAKSGGLDISI